ncbi:MAG: hypothetical protein PHO89_09470 [Methylacidiphilaceae bacterium]|nr:hypothetical protein [Candidatus Methylacidiphilaceae bacterium]
MAPSSPEEARERAIREMAASFPLNPGVRDDPELRKMREELCRFAYPILEEKRRKGELPPEMQEKPKNDPSRSSSIDRGYSFRQERPTAPVLARSEGAPSRRIGELHRISGSFVVFLSSLCCRSGQALRYRAGEVGLSQVLHE